MLKNLILSLVVILLSSCDNQICGVLLESGYINDKYYVKLNIDNDTVKFNVDYNTYKSIGNFDYELPYCLTRQTIIENAKKRKQKNSYDEKS